MITPSEIKRKAAHRAPRLFRSQIQGEQWEPWLVGFRSPKESELSFKEVNEWTLSLFRNSKESKGYGYRVETRSRRFHGTNDIPDRIVFDTPDDVYSFCGTGEIYRKALQNFELVRSEFPELEPWLTLNPGKIRDLEKEWKSILRILKSYRTTPRPGCFLREFQAAPHSKYMENNRTLLEDLLRLTSPGSVDKSKRSFEERFGFKSKPRTSFIRFLDPSYIPNGFPSDWAALPNESIARLELPPKLIISENKIPILSLPNYKDTIAMWGKGKAVALLEHEQWLSRFQIYYWGDIDCHGLQILSSFRKSYPDTVPIAMDTKTLEKYKGLASYKGAVLAKCPSHLTADEQSLFANIAANSILLEHERIPHEYILEEFENAGFVGITPRR